MKICGIFIGKIENRDTFLFLSGYDILIIKLRIPKEGNIDFERIGYEKKINHVVFRRYLTYDGLYKGRKHRR